MLIKLHAPKAQLKKVRNCKRALYMYYNIAKKYISDACNYQNGDTH